MRSNSLKKLMGASSMVALSVGVAAVPAHQASAQSTGVYGGGSSLSSEFMRQVQNCYDHHQVAGDSQTPGFTALCTTAVTGSVETLFASVGSGRGQQAYFTDDPTQLVNGGTQATGAGIGLPGTPPLYIDGSSTSSAFNSYPYPELEYAASDSPLAATVAGLTTTAYTYSTTGAWATANSAGVITGAAPTVATVFNAAYNAASYGQPIQLPAFEVPVAIAVNTSGLTVHSANQHTGGSTAPGNAIQLDTAQVCAIFAGAVTDWSSTQQIAKLINDPILGLTVTSEAFSDPNVSVTNGTSAQYSATSRPIHVIYRGDGSGTSFIITNYLQSSCVQLDNGSNNYAAIFGAANLPSTTFANLLTNITANGGSVANFTAETGTQAVASTIGNATATAGNIGYISNDFTAAFATLTSTAPLSASIQDEAEMENGFNLPSDETFPAPTPANADNAFVQISSQAPSTTSTFNAWNVYGKVYDSSNTFGLTGKSILGVSDGAGAYPVVGTTFLMVYSCYNSSKIAKVTNFLDWYFNSSVNTGAANPAVQQVLNSDGFQALTTTWSSAVVKSYLTSSSSVAIRQGNTAGTNCAGIPGA